jgi:hypothetical protein
MPAQPLRMRGAAMEDDMLELWFAYLAGFLTPFATITLIITALLIKERIREGR